MRRRTSRIYLWQAREELALKSLPPQIFTSIDHGCPGPGLGSGRVKSEGVLRAINELSGGSALRKATPFQLFSLITLVPVWISRALIDCLCTLSRFLLVNSFPSLSLSSEEERTISSVVSQLGLGPPTRHRGSGGVTKNQTQKVTQTFRKYNQLSGHIITCTP